MTAHASAMLCGLLALSLGVACLAGCKKGGSTNTPPLDLRESNAVIVKYDDDKSIIDVMVLDGLPLPDKIYLEDEWPAWYACFGKDVPPEVAGKQFKSRRVEYELKDGRITSATGWSEVIVRPEEDLLTPAFLDAASKFYQDKDKHPSMRPITLTPNFPPLLPVLTSDQAKEVFLKIEPGFSFETHKMEYLGTEDEIYYADRTFGPVQVTINVMKMPNPEEASGSISIMISCPENADAAVAKEMAALADKFVGGFLDGGFVQSPHVWRTLDAIMKQRVFDDNNRKRYAAEDDNYSLEYAIERPSVDGSSLEYRLRITHQLYQKALNERYEKMGQNIPATPLP